MKKIIKISGDLDFIYLTVDGKTHSRYPAQNSNQQAREAAINEAKIHAFSVAWELAELGNEIILNPYIN